LTRIEGRTATGEGVIRAVGKGVGSAAEGPFVEEKRSEVGAGAGVYGIPIRKDASPVGPGVGTGEGAGVGAGVGAAGEGVAKYLLQLPRPCRARIRHNRSRCRKTGKRKWVDTCPSRI